MPIYHSKFFPESALAHELLDGLKCLSIGDSAHNDWGLDTTNVDYTDDMTTVYKLEEIRLCGEARPVDIVAPGDCIPVADKSFDAVINSHVIEHFFDPIKAIKEWMRIATKYVFIIAPLRDALPSDRDKPITPLQELIDRHTGAIPAPEVDTHEHYTRFTPELIAGMCNTFGWHICNFQFRDDKVGNGHTFVIDVEKTEDAAIVGALESAWKRHPINNAILTIPSE